MGSYDSRVIEWKEIWANDTLKEMVHVGLFFLLMDKEIVFFYKIWNFSNFKLFKKYINYDKSLINNYHMGHL